jgi:AraC-like DNA-binding protein
MVGTANYISFHEDDLDHAKADVGRDGSTTRLDMVDRRTPYDVRFDGVEFGAVSVVRYRSGAAVRTGTSDLQTCFSVDLPDTGVKQVEHRSESTEAFPGRAVICQDVGDVSMTIGDGYSAYTVRIDRDALDDTLLELLGHSPGHPLDPEAGMDLRAPAGMRWARLVQLLCAAAEARSPVLRNPLVAAPLHDAVVEGLLAAADHRDRAEMERPVHSWCLEPVHRTTETMHDQPEYPFTPALLARASGVSERSLYEGFLRHVGWPPMTYLRRVRLERAYHDLRDGSDDETSVDGVAGRWGFDDPGRFTEDDGRVYGRSPAETLHVGRTG